MPKDRSNHMRADHSTVPIKPASEFRMAHTRWLWPGWFPCGELVLLEGDGGFGKSTILYDIAARVSSGGPMPFCEEPQEPAHVLVATAEDDWGRVVVPRLRVAQADTTRIHALGDLDHLVVLPDDVEAIRNELRNMQSRGMRVRLLIFDPVYAFLSSELDPHKDADIRRATTPLAGLASEFDVTIVLVRHISKNGHQPAAHRGGGSLAVRNAARFACMVGGPKEASVRDARALVATKSNVGVLPESILYRLVADVVSVDGIKVPTSKVEWLRTWDGTADGLVLASGSAKRPSKTKQAQQLLEVSLREGCCPQTELVHAVKSMGISERTLDTAKSKLNVIAHRCSFQSQSYWRLPNSDCTCVGRKSEKQIAPYVERNDPGGQDSCALLDSEDKNTRENSNERIERNSTEDFAPYADPQPIGRNNSESHEWIALYGDDDLSELIEERAAIMEYDGGLSRHEAYLQAAELASDVAGKVDSPCG